MKIEEGKFYRTRDGQKVGPMVFNRKKSLYPWMCQSSRHTFTDEGRFSHMAGDSILDLVAEWTEELDTPKLWRDMTPEEKGAFWVKVYRGDVVELSWDKIYWQVDKKFNPSMFPNVYYRIRPVPCETGPKRETVTLYGLKDSLGWGFGVKIYGDTHTLTLPLIGGDLIPGTYTHPEGHTITVERIKP
jgi:hypothetical protein